jgi:predicted 3-demethylubiquinone-9 3-methyltransferase (glyoxalase superfamily)
VQKVTPFLWFDDQAEPAATTYVSLFEDSSLEDVSRMGDDAVMSVSFRLAGQPFIALNGGVDYTLSPAYSMFVSCEDQAEIDRLWTALTADGGTEDRCGWLVDRFGLSWQIVPESLSSLLSGGGDPERAQRVTQAMLGMRKLDLAALQAAYDA